MTTKPTKGPKQPRAAKARALPSARPVSDTERAAEVADFNNRARAREVADRIEAGCDLDITDRWLAAGLLRRWANREQDKPKRPRGRPPTHAAGDVALLFVVRRSHPDCGSDDEAVGRVALDLDMSEDTVRDILRRPSR